MRSGGRLYVSGTVGANAEGKPDDLDSQMKNAYAAIQKTLAQYKIDASHVIMERITRPIWTPLFAARRRGSNSTESGFLRPLGLKSSGFMGAADKIEIEVQVALDSSRT